MRSARIIATLLVLVMAAPSSAFAAQPLTIQDLDTSEFPEVTMRVSAPAALLAAGDAPTFSVAENGRAIDEVLSEAAKADPSTSYSVLVVDTSGSMQGAPIDDARAAAGRFVDELGANAKIAIVSFSDEPKLLTDFTNDRAKLQRAIDSLGAEGETAMYDALKEAARIMPADAGAMRNIVLLSDGGDTVSDGSLTSAIDSVKRSKAPVHAVALKTKESQTKTLSIIAEDTGGRLVPVSKSSALSDMFTGIARELRDVYLVSYSSNEPQTKDIELDVTAAVGDESSSARIAYPNPAFALVGASSALRIPEVQENAGMFAVAVGLAFLSMLALFFGVLLIVIRPATAMKQLRYYDQVERSEASDAGDTHVDKVRTGLVDAVGYVAGKRGITKMVALRLEQAGLPLRPAEYMTFHLLGVVGAGFITQLLLGRLPVSVLIIVLATILPIMFVGYRVERRRQSFEDQLPDVLSMMAGSLRGGWGIQQAIDLVVQEAMPPAAEEFKRVQTEARLGMPLEQSLVKMADRMESESFKAVVSAITIQREVGGNLSEVLDVVAGTVRERAALKRQVHALTAEGRISAIILVCLPIVEAVALMLLSPDYLTPLYTTFFGWAALLTGTILMVIGSVWLMRVTKIEV